MTSTPMFRTLTQCIALDTALAQRWWQALMQARWSVPRSWLADVRYFDARPVRRIVKLDGVLLFLKRTSPPSRVIDVLEALTQEQLLTRQQATTIQTKVLDCVDARGEWFWSDASTKGVV